MPLTGQIYTLARKSIRVDTTPLFRNQNPISPRSAKSRPPKEGHKTFSEMLNEALESPSASPNTGSRHQVNLSAPYLSKQQPLENPSPPMGSMGLGAKPAVHDTDEMDWTPTQSQRVPRRPFGEPAQKWPTQRFGETPVVNHESAFWYKVPPAPATLARQKRNPQMPILKSKPVEKEQTFFTAKKEVKPQAPAEEDTSIAFKNPTFFAPVQVQERSMDSNLADLLNQSFSISQEPDEVRHNNLARSAQGTQPSKVSLGVEFAIVACLLSLWLVTISIPVPFARELQLALLSGAGTIAVMITGETTRDTREDQAPSTAVYVGSVLSVVELAAVCWLGWEVWKTELDVAQHGVGVLATMLAHQFWNATR